MSFPNFSPSYSHQNIDSSNPTIDEKREFLLEKIAQLPTPEEMSSLLDELLKNVGDIVIIGQRMLDSENRTSSSDDVRLQ